MYELDFTTCSAADVIRRSVVCHPSLFVDALRGAAKVHIDYARITSRGDVATIAARMARRLLEVADVVADCDTETAVAHATDDLEALVLAFTEACKLQVIPRHVSAEIIGRVVGG